MIQVGDWVELNPGATNNFCTYMVRIATENPKVQVIKVVKISWRGQVTTKIEFEGSSVWTWLECCDHFFPLDQAGKIRKPKKIELIW